MKWAFIYTLDDPTDETRIDRVGTLVCVGVRKLYGDRKSVV